MISRLLFTAWIVAAGLLSLMSFSDYVFYNFASGKRLLLRLALAVVWPFACLSSKGRNVLFSNIEGV